MTGRRLGGSLIAAYAALLAVATLAPLPADAYEVADALISDKAVHFLLFGGLALLLYLVRAGVGGHPEAVILVTALAAGLVELIQWPLPYRTADWLDLLAGAAGGVIAVLAAVGVRRVVGYR